MQLKRAFEFLQTGQFAQAEAAFRALLKHQPNNPELHYNLALALINTGDLTTAETHFGRCARLAPGNAEVLNSLGNVQRLLGKKNQARKNIKRALQLQPGHPGALCNRGWLSLGNGEAAQAAADFKAALAAAPQIAEASRGLGEALTTLRDWQGAREALQNALKHNPGSADVLNSLGVMEAQQNHAGAAITFFERAITAQPQHADALINHGITSEQLGQLEQAEQSLLQALKVRPDFPEAHFHLAHLAGHQTTALEVAAMEDTWVKHNTGSAGMHLGFALGKALDKQQQFDRAFTYFKKARDILTRQQNFDLQGERLRLQAIREVRPASAQHSEENMSAPIFVIGMPRSGTTLTEQILASHSQTHALGETGRIERAATALPGITGDAFPQGLASLTSEQSVQLRDLILADLDVPEENHRLVETTPTNFQYIGLILAVFPNARLVHCVRNPLDTCLSIYQHPLSQAHAYANRLESLADYYTLYQGMMQHWHDYVGEQLYDLVYEELVEHPEQQIRMLLEHCQLDFEPTCVEFHHSKRAIYTPSASQVRQPLSDKSVGRWRNYEEFLAPLIQRLG